MTSWPAGAARAVALFSALCAAASGAAGCVAPEERVDIPYDDRHGSSTLMDVYLPDGDGAANPTVLFIHGGSWRFGSKEHFVAAGRRLARSGFVVASINYRLLPEGRFPKNLFDATCALAYLRAHAAELRIDPERIAVMGYSAGAHLASLVGLASSHPELTPDCDAAAGLPVAPPAAVISASGPQDMRTFWEDAGDRSDVEEIFGGSPAELPRAYELGSPRYHVAPGAPPFLILEDAVDFGGIEDMRAALADAGNQVRLLKVNGSLHILEQHADPGVYEAGVSSETPEAWIAITDFLFRTIAREPAP
jgi:acetyl esterase/lipase